MKYYKETVKSDGRKLIAGGPRDNQRRQKEAQQSEILISTLREQILELTAQLEKRGATLDPGTRNVDFFSGEQVDEEIRKAVSEAVGEVSIKYQKRQEELKIEVADLIKEISGLKMALSSKEELIKELRESKQIDSGEIARIVAMHVNKAVGSQVVVDSIDEDYENRPKMEPIFVDPVESDAGDYLDDAQLKSEVHSGGGEIIADKVSRLKDLLGGLPNVGG